MIEKIQVPSQPGLDMVNVYFDNIEPAKGRVILECYGMCWCAYWGSIGADRTIQEFFKDASVDYIAGNMICARHQKRDAVSMKYLEKIIRAVQDHIKPQAEAA